MSFLELRFRQHQEQILGRALLAWVSLDAGSYPPQLSPRGTVQGRLLRPDSFQMGSGTRGVILVTQSPSVQ